MLTEHMCTWQLEAVTRSREAWEGFEDDFRRFSVEKRVPCRRMNGAP